MAADHSSLREVDDQARARLRAIEGFLIGMAVGDAIGLPFEGLSARRVERMLGRGALGHRFVFGRGMISDDTEHACMTVQAFLESGGGGNDDPGEFAKLLRRKLKWWIAGCPAGVGLATARACVKMWIGVPADRSGVCSAGNGPAMRSGALGVLASRERLAGYVRASTRLTHTDPRAEQGAMVIALCARESSQAGQARTAIDSSRVREVVRVVGDSELRRLVLSAIDAAERGASAVDVAQEMGLARGVSGFINHTVPVCVFLWLRHGDEFARAIEEAVRLGGDTDTVAAIVGGLVGARCGREGMPREWVDGIGDWPRSVTWIQRLASCAAAGQGRFPSLVWPLVLLRNVVFLVVVLSHGLRRLLPPW